jgi:hypothetical protein
VTGCKRMMGGGVGEGGSGDPPADQITFRFPEIFGVPAETLGTDYLGNGVRRQVLCRGRTLASQAEWRKGLRVRIPAVVRGKSFIVSRVLRRAV